MPDSAALAVECSGITVRYGDVAALTDVSFALERRRIHAVVGQNGAGKTTFARVVAGLVQPVHGRMILAGRSVQGGSVNEARAAGIELVHQSFALPPSFTVAEALEFGSRRHAGWPFSRRALDARWAPHLRDLGIEVGVGDTIRDLPVESQQAVEIARALVTDAKVLILDEPTAVLAPSGIEALFRRLRTLRDTGVTIILVLHKIREVMAVAETVTVLRGGRLVEGPLPLAATSPERLSASIIGPGQSIGATAADRDSAALVGAGALPAIPVAHDRVAAKATVLALSDVSTAPDGEGVPLSGVDLMVARGEIVGIAGVEGNGQRALVRALAGLAALQAGTIMLAGADVTAASLVERRASGLRIIPFERNVEGLSLSSTLWENWAALRLLLGRSLRFISPARLRADCTASLEAWNVRFANTSQNAGSLSGGNAQKVILAREMDEDAELVIAAQPTRGLDIGASAFVWTSLRRVRDRQCGVLLISSDLDELFDISDRIVVMASGKIAGIFHPPFSIGEIGAAMTGMASA